MGHLDCPLADWPQSVSATPAAAMGLQEYGQLRVGGPADFILFSARSLSELLSRPQTDRVVVRNGVPIEAMVPDFSELDYGPGAQHASSRSMPAQLPLDSQTSSSITQAAAASGKKNTAVGLQAVMESGRGLPSGPATGPPWDVSALLLASLAILAILAAAAIALTANSLAFAPMLKPT